MKRVKTPYEPGKSVYSLAYEKICELYESEKYVPLAAGRVQKLFESTPEICFAAGTTLDEALGKLSTWKLIFRGKISGLEGERVIPLKG